MAFGFKNRRRDTAPSGTMLGGGVAQLLSIGLMNAHLNGPKPDVSFFQSSIVRHSHFAIEVCPQSFMGMVSFGGEMSLTVQKTADLLGSTYVVIDIPGIRAERQDGANIGRRGGSSNRHGSSNGRARASRFGGKSSSTRRSTQHISQSQFPHKGRHSGGSSNGAGRRHRAVGGGGHGRRRRNIVSDSEDEDAFVDSRSSRMAQGVYLDDADDYDDAFEDMPSDEDEVEEEAWCHWVNDFGYAAINRVSISLASTVAQTLTGRFMHVHNELCSLPGKDVSDMIGHYNTRAELIEASKTARRFYIPVPFSHARFTGRALPLISFRFHGATLSLVLNELQKLIKVSGPDVTVVKEDGVMLQPTDVGVSMDLSYIFLDVEERERFAQGRFTQLWDQTQYLEITSKGASINTELDFNHPAKAFIWCVQRKEAAAQNDTFDYSSITPGIDPISHCKFTINGVPRFSREGEYFRKVVPHEHFPSKPKCPFLYAFCFGMDADSQNSTGTLNLSRIEHSKFSVDLDDELADEPVTLYLYDMSLNMIVMKKGLISVAYQ